MHYNLFNNSNDEEKADMNIEYLKNELKIPKNMIDYIQNNKKNLPEGLEIINYFDSGSESIVYSSLINCKNNEGKKKKNKCDFKINVILLMILQLIIQKRNFVMKIMNPLLFVVL